MAPDSSESPDGAAEAPPKRRLTAIEALEAYSSAHPETIAELLEWPYRRFRRSLEAWQRREVVKEWSQRKQAHINAILSNGNYGGDDLQQAVRDLEIQYDQIITELQMSKEEREAIDSEFNSDFMRAGHRAAARSVEWAAEAPVMPGEAVIRKLPDG